MAALGLSENGRCERHDLDRRKPPERAPKVVDRYIDSYHIGSERRHTVKA